GYRSRSEPVRSASCRGSLVASSAGLGAPQSTRSLGQTKEPRTRPMGLSNPLGNCRERSIAPALVLEPVLANEHLVRMSAPLAHQRRAGLEGEAGIDGHRGFV